MAKHSPNVIVRAYDLGGFGDIAGAMRVASYFNRSGLEVQIKGTSPSALQKLGVLKPDVHYGNGDIDHPEAIQVDIAGHYHDNRNSPNKDVPHHFTEDMDNPGNRRKVVPIYLKSGMQKQFLSGQVGTMPVNLNMMAHAPLFYRPFREWIYLNLEKEIQGSKLLKFLQRKEF